ncbi:MAG: hypothetical protein C0466_10995 [Candidatus Accumulibacter sp.]|nr:hypothetical protein [Accumulibacter sp.]
MGGRQGLPVDGQRETLAPVFLVAQLVEVEHAVAAPLDEQDFGRGAGHRPGFDQREEKALWVDAEEDEAEQADGLDFAVVQRDDQFDVVPGVRRPFQIAQLGRHLSGGAAHQFAGAVGDRQGVRRRGQDVALRVEQRGFAVIEIAREALQPAGDARFLPVVQVAPEPVDQGRFDHRVGAQHVGVAQAFASPVGDLLGLEVGDDRELLLRLRLQRRFLRAVEKVVHQADPERQQGEYGEQRELVS